MIGLLHAAARGSGVSRVTNEGGARGGVRSPGNAPGRGRWCNGTHALFVRFSDRLCQPKRWERQKVRVLPGDASSDRSAGSTAASTSCAGLSRRTRSEGPPSAAAGPRAGARRQRGRRASRRASAEPPVTPAWESAGGRSGAFAWHLLLGGSREGALPEGVRSENPRTVTPGAQNADGPRRRKRRRGGAAVGELSSGSRRAR